MQNSTVATTSFATFVRLAKPLVLVDDNGELALDKTHRGYEPLFLMAMNLAQPLGEIDRQNRLAELAAATHTDTRTEVQRVNDTSAVLIGVSSSLKNVVVDNSIAYTSTQTWAAEMKAKTALRGESSSPKNKMTPSSKTLQDCSTYASHTSGSPASPSPLGRTGRPLSPLLKPASSPPAILPHTPPHVLGQEAADASSTKQASTPTAPLSGHVISATTPPPMSITPSRRASLSTSPGSMPSPSPSPSARSADSRSGTYNPDLFVGASTVDISTGRAYLLPTLVGEVKIHPAAPSRQAPRSLVTREALSQQVLYSSAAWEQGGTWAGLILINCKYSRTCVLEHSQMDCIQPPIQPPPDIPSPTADDTNSAFPPLAIAVEVPEGHDHSGILTDIAHLLAKDKSEFDAHSLLANDLLHQYHPITGYPEMDSHGHLFDLKAVSRLWDILAMAVEQVLRLPVGAPLPRLPPPSDAFLEYYKELVAASVIEKMDAHKMEAVAKVRRSFSSKETPRKRKHPSPIPESPDAEERPDDEDDQPPPGQGGETGESWGPSQTAFRSAPFRDGGDGGGSSGASDSDGDSDYASDVVDWSKERPVYIRFTSPDEMTKLLQLRADPV